MGDDTLAQDLPRFTVRIPEVLRARIESYATKRKAEYPKYSLNDFFLEAAREKLDGPPVMAPVLRPIQEPGVEYRVFQDGEPRPGYPAPAVQVGRVGEGFWDNWMRESKRLDGEAKQESFNEALRERVAAGLHLPPKWGKMSAEMRMSWLRFSDKE